MYLPQHNAVLVPAASDWQHSLSEGAPSQMVVLPPRRRRPLAAILKLIGGRIMVEPQDEVSEILSQTGVDIDKEKLENLRLLIKVADQDPSLLVKTVSEKTGKQANHDRQTYLLHNLHRFIPPAQYIGSELPEPEMTVNKAFRFAVPNEEDGFSYVYKYTVPQRGPKEGRKQNVEVSLQQGKNMAYPHIVNPLTFDTVRDNVRSRAPLPEVVSARKTNGNKHEQTARQSADNDETKIGPIGPSLLSQFLNSDDKENEGGETESAEVENKKTTSLILKPVARAVAGPRGVAVAAPIARAILKKGEKVSLEFDPDAVAIAGPGGKAHAHPQFIIDYVEDVKVAAANTTAKK